MRFERVWVLVRVMVMVDDADVECDRVAIGGRVGVGGVDWVRARAR